MEITLYGGCGFIGSTYRQLYDCVVNDKYDLQPKTDHVLYMISTTHNYHVQTNPYVDIDTNLTMLIRVLEQFKHRIGVFNFISSWFVYGNHEGEVTESTYCNPTGFYSITKRTAEQLLIEYCKTYNIQYRILRLCNVLGKTDNASSKKNALTHVINQLRNNKPVVLLNNGQFYRDYMHVDDVCRAIHTVIHTGEINTVYNIGTGTPTLFSDVILNAKQILNSSSEITVQPGNTTSMWMNCDKLKQLQFSPAIPLTQIISEICHAGTHHPSNSMSML